MAFAPLLLTGNLRINGDSVAEQVTSFMFKGARDSITVPATFGARKSFRPGDDSYEVDIAYLTDTDSDALSTIFWDALADADGTVDVAGTLRPGAVSATNPEYTATALVTGAGIGGDVNTIGVDSQTFPLTDRPTKNVTP